MILLCIVADKTRFSARVQRLFVKWIEGMDCPSGPYHGAWYDTETREFYDMNTTFRKVGFDKYKDRRLFFFQPPVPIDVDYLDRMIGKRRYGILDVLLYGPAKLFGINLPGDHCTEALNDDIWFHGGRTPWHPFDAPPAPCEMLIWASTNLQEVSRESATAS